MTLYEYLSLHTDCELEVRDNTWDYMTNVYWDDSFRQTEKDWNNDTDRPNETIYLKFCIIFCKYVDIVNLYTGNGVVDITGFIKKYKNVFEQYMRDHWRADCQFDPNGDDFYDQWVRELCLWIEGNATASQMRKLVELIEKEDKHE